MAHDRGPGGAPEDATTTDSLRESLGERHCADRDARWGSPNTGKPQSGTGIDLTDRARKSLRRRKSASRLRDRRSLAMPWKVAVSRDFPRHRDHVRYRSWNWRRVRHAWSYQERRRNSGILYRPGRSNGSAWSARSGVTADRFSGASPGAKAMRNVHRTGLRCHRKSGSRIVWTLPDDIGTSTPIAIDHVTRERRAEFRCRMRKAYDDEVRG